jgi:aminocarboxymuconate-semialdehyde decarboxylase
MHARRNSRIPTIDIHAHYYPQSYFDLIAAEGARFKAEYRMTPEGFSFDTPGGSGARMPMKFIDLEQRFAEMDKAKVDVHVLSLSQPMVYWADADLSHRLAQAWNDGASAAHVAHPDRILAFMTLPMLDRDRALDELRRAAKLPGMCGVYLGTNIDNHDLDDPLFAPIFAEIEKLDLPVFLHPIQPTGGKRLNFFQMHNALGFPFDTAIAACHLIFGGVLDRHPKLKVNLPHAGGVLPILIGRIDHAYHVSGGAKHIAQPPSAYLKRFTYDTITHSKPILEWVISRVGINRIMLGSDYCFPMGTDRPVKIVDQLGLDDRQRNMILGGTAAKLLKI